MTNNFGKTHTFLTWRTVFFWCQRQATRRVSPGRIIVLLFWTKYVVPHQIKPRIFKSTIRRGQKNIWIVLINICGNWAENDYYRLLSCRFGGIAKFGLPHVYCGRSCRIRGLFLFRSASSRPCFPTARWRLCMPDEEYVIQRGMHHLTRILTRHLVTAVIVYRNVRYLKSNKLLQVKTEFLSSHSTIHLVLYDSVKNSRTLSRILNSKQSQTYRKWVA